MDDFPVEACILVFPIVAVIVLGYTGIRTGRKYIDPEYILSEQDQKRWRDKPQNVRIGCGLLVIIWGVLTFGIGILGVIAVIIEWFSFLSEIL